MVTMETISTKKIKQIPIMIISGFLGAGKTTFLNYILKSNHGLRPAVLVNDFGKINIDAQLVENVDEDGTVNLSNGCICCSIRGDLIGAVVKQYTKLNPPDYIIIECSGVSNPGEIVTTFMSPLLRPFIKIDGIITIVDAEQILALSQRYADLAREQIEYATLVILNKLDLINQDELQKLQQWVRTITPEARILKSCYGQVPLEFILGVGHFDSIKVFKELKINEIATEHQEVELSQTASQKDTHQKVFSSFSYATQEPLNSERFKQLIQRLPATIYRAKGFVYFGDFKDTEYIFHVVGRWAHLTPGRKWGKKKPRTYIVMIGEQGALDEIALNVGIVSCLQKNCGDHESRINRLPSTRKLKDS